MGMPEEQGDTTMNRPQPANGSPAPAFPAFDLPARQVSAWVVETDPEAARSWLADVAAADSTDSVQQLYRALYTLNRMTVPVEDRLVLMELYREPVAAAAARLQAHFAHLAVPLKPRLQQLAEFLGQLHREMAYGYQHVLQALRGERRPWENEVFVFALERSIRARGEMLLQSYQVYRPAPAGIWRELHGFYRYASEHGCHRTAIAPEVEAASIETAYLQVLLLGLCGPYQLPFNECRRVNGFLARWAGKATLRSEPAAADVSGHFLLDLDADHPPVPCPRDVSLRVAPAWRVVNAIELARVAHDFIQRLQKGESPKTMDLGFECVGNACRDTLRRMLRAWGLAGRRQFTRRRVRQPLSLCIGLNALHFFAADQQPFAPPRSVSHAPPAQTASARALHIETTDTDAPPPVSPEIYRIDSRWQVRDESAAGLSLLRHGSAGLPIRVGELVGVQDPARGAWRPATVRWVKSNNAQHVEVGIEMLAPAAQPIAARSTESATSTYLQALLVPRIAVLHQPATLLLSSSMNVQPGHGLELVAADQPPRRVRVLSIPERTSAFVQAVFADEYH